MTSLAAGLSIDLYPRSEKPRSRGKTMVIDLGTPRAIIESGLEAFGGSVDLVKIVDLHLNWPLAEVKRKIEAYKAHGVLVEPGGVIIELARDQIARTPAGNRQLLDRFEKLGFDALEVSATTGGRAMELDSDLIQLAKGRGFQVYGEVGQKFAATDTTRSDLRTIDREATLTEMRALVEAGCDYIVWEGHVLRQVMGTTPAEVVERDAEAQRQLLPIVEEIGIDRMLLEVSSLIPFDARRALQFALVRLFGPEVNVGNVRFDEVPFMEGIRHGTWPVFGLGDWGDHPWIRANRAGDGDGEWWRPHAETL